MGASLGRGLRAVGGAAVTAGAAALTWGVAVERNRFRVREETLPVLDEGADPIRVLHISDLHMAPWQRAKQEWVRHLVHLRPDVVINTGDNLGHRDGLLGVRAALEPFEGIPGVFVHGSNDVYGPMAKNPFTYLTGPTGGSGSEELLDTAGLEAFFGSLGWVDVNNAVHLTSLHDTPIEFIGTGDAHRDWDRLEVLPGALDEVRERSDAGRGPAGQETIQVGVTHAPYQRVLDAFVNHGADVIFAGHTHGGQVRVPGVGALVTNCDLPRRLASGVSVWRHGLGSSYLNVSAGLGTSIFAPVRFACRPEAVLVTLVARDFRYP